MNLTVTIPGKIDPLLTPNRGQRNPHGKARVRAEAKEMAFLYAKHAAHRQDITGVDRAVYHIERGQPKWGQPMDKDNLVAACKSHLDGIAKALGVDDRGWQIGTVRQVRDPDGVGYLAITLEWAQAQEDAA